MGYNLRCIKCVTDVRIFQLRKKFFRDFDYPFIYMMNALNKFLHIFKTLFFILFTIIFHPLFFIFAGKREDVKKMTSQIINTLKVHSS